MKTDLAPHRFFPTAIPPTRPGKGIEAVRPIRDEIDARVRALTAEIVPAADADADAVN